MIKPNDPRCIRNWEQMKAIREDLIKKYWPDYWKRDLDEDEIEAIELRSKWDPSWWDKINEAVRLVRKSLEDEWLL